jgi:hypothetical protein
VFRPSSTFSFGLIALRAAAVSRSATSTCRPKTSLWCFGVAYEPLSCQPMPMMPQRASAASSIALSIPESFPTKLRTATITVRGGAAGQTSEGPGDRRELYSLRRGQRSGDRRAPGGRQRRYLAPVRPRHSRNGQQKWDEQQQQEPQAVRHAGARHVPGRRGRGAGGAGRGSSCSRSIAAGCRRKKREQVFTYSVFLMFFI